MWNFIDITAMNVGLPHFAKLFIGQYQAAAVQLGKENGALLFQGC